MRFLSPSGSKVITDPVQLGPDLVELLAQRLVVALGHERDGTRQPQRGPEPPLVTQASWPPKSHQLGTLRRSAAPHPGGVPFPGPTDPRFDAALPRPARRGTTP